MNEQTGRTAADGIRVRLAQTIGGTLVVPSAPVVNVFDVHAGSSQPRLPGQRLLESGAGWHLTANEDWLALGLPAMT
ncbi:MAG: hypothetical protein ACN6N0_14770, partial [Microvirgula sp.]